MSNVETASPAVVYSTAIERFASGQLSWETEDVRVMLVGPAYEPDRLHDATKADLKRAEIVSPGYLSGGARLGDRSIERDPGLLGATRLVAGRVSWDGITAEFDRAVVWAPQLDQLIGAAYLGLQRLTDAFVQLDFRDGVLEFVTEVTVG